MSAFMPAEVKAYCSFEFMGLNSSFALLLEDCFEYSRSLEFYMNFRIDFSISTKKDIDNLIGISLVALNRINILTTLCLPIHECGLFFFSFFFYNYLLFVSFFISFSSILWFSLYKSFISLFKFSIHILFFNPIAVISGIVSVTCSSNSSLLVYRMQLMFVC
jgi:hypothetical protein